MPVMNVPPMAVAVIVARYTVHRSTVGQFQIRLATGGITSQDNPPMQNEMRNEPSNALLKLSVGLSLVIPPERRKKPNTTSREMIASLKTSRAQLRITSETLPGNMATYTGRFLSR